MYIGHVDYGDKVLYKFNLTLDMKKSRQLMVDGKLKEFPEDHKQLIRDHIKERGFKNANRIKEIIDSDGILISAAPDMKSESSETQINEIIIKLAHPYESNKEE